MEIVVQMFKLGLVGLD